MILALNVHQMNSSPTAQERAAEIMRAISYPKECEHGVNSVCNNCRVKLISEALAAHADAKLSKAIAGIKSVEIPEGSGFIQGLRRNCVEVVERLKSGRESEK